MAGRQPMRYDMSTGAEVPRNPQPVMTATLVQQESDNYFNLITEKGKQIGVCFHPWGRISVYIQSQNRPGLSAGRRFGTIAEAIAAYKAADVRAALSALLPA